MVGGTTGGDEYLGVGIADSIITRLAGLRQVGLRPTAAVLGYADAPADPATVAKALAVDRVLVGTIQRSADTYRITLQLVQSADGAVSWARSYDVPRSALTNLQDTIAEEVVTALRLELTPAERDRVRRRYTDNAQAYDLYLRGRASFVNYTERGMKTAIGDFERALSVDPDYALARAGLAIACAWFSIRYAYETEASEWGARAEREAKAALADDPSLAEATLAMASAAGTVYGDFNWPVVIADATRALAMDPTLELAHIVRMRAFYHLGLFERDGAGGQGRSSAESTGQRRDCAARSRRRACLAARTAAPVSRPRCCSLARTRRSSAITSGSHSSIPVTWRAPARRWPPCSARDVQTSVHKRRSQVSRRQRAIQLPPEPVRLESSGGHTWTITSPIASVQPGPSSVTSPRP